MPVLDPHLSSKSRYEQANALWDRVLGDLAMEPKLTQRQACARHGRSYSTFVMRKRKNPDFAARLNAVMNGRRHPDERYTGSFESFRRAFFKMTTYWHQGEIVKAIEGAKPMEITLVLVPPEFGKTSVMEDWVCFKLAKDPNHRITVVSEGQPHARKIVGRIARRMTDAGAFKDYIERFGPFKLDGREQTWTKDFFRVIKCSADERDYSLEARGWTSAVAGSRVDTMIVDDIMSRRNLGQTAEVLEKFRQDFLSRVGRQGRIVIVGTRVDNDDFYEAIEDAGIVNHVVRLPATHWSDVEPCPLGEDCNVPEIAHARSMCPQMWSTHELAMRRKQVGEAAWFRNYMQSPVLAGDATFTEAMVEGAKDPSRDIGPAKRGQAVVVGLDPAFDRGCCSLVALGYDTARFDILDVENFNVPRTEDILAHLARFADAYGPTDVVIEVNAFQRGLARDERLLAMQKRYGFRIREHVTHRNKADDLIGIPTMAGAFLREEFSIPWASEPSQQRMAQLVNELRSWRPDIRTRKLRQDCVVALWFAWIVAMERRGLLHRKAPIRRKGLPYQPTAYTPVLSRGLPA